MDHPQLQMNALFVFDYDHTIVCDNSDTCIPVLLNSEHGVDMINKYDGSDSWTQLMDQVVVAAQTKDGKTIEDIRINAAKVPCFPELPNILRLVKNHGPVHIVSDANTLYIESFLQHHKIDVNQVHTNPALVQDGLLRVFPYAKVPHGCKRCPSNMCKSVIVKDSILPIVGREERPRIIYFGDGSNDYCPVFSVLNERDVVFARDDPNEPRARGLVRQLERNPVKANVIRWATGKDLLESVHRLLRSL